MIDDRRVPWQLRRPQALNCTQFWRGAGGGGQGSTYCKDPAPGSGSNCTADQGVREAGAGSRQREVEGPGRQAPRGPAAPAGPQGAAPEQRRRAAGAGRALSYPAALPERGARGPGRCRPKGARRAPALGVQAQADRLVPLTCCGSREGGRPRKHSPVSEPRGSSSDLHRHCRRDALSKAGQIPA